MQRESIEIQLTPKERALILRYGYPFDGIEQALRALADTTTIEIIPVDPFELERLLGDLSISINDMKPSAVRDRLFDLCDRLEYAERTGDGMLFDEF